MRIGDKFGRLTVKGLGYRRGTTNKKAVLVLCLCGNSSVVTENNLVTGNTTSCGCYGKEQAKKASTTHGHASGRKTTKTYRAWRSMWQRCTNPSQDSFCDYGGRGISVCKRWQSFEAFLKDMGEAPVLGTLDRVDFNGNYEPSNCRWATWSEQNKNRRSWR